MSYNGSGTFNINTSGQPVVTGTTITSTAFNLLTADLATGLTTALTKDGQTTPTANIPMGTFKITGLGAGSAATDAAQYGQLQTGATNIATVSGTDTLTGSLTPALTAYATGNLFSFIAANTNTGATTINLNSLGAKSITKQGSTALSAGDLVSGRVYLIEYDGTRFQLIGNVATATTVSDTVNSSTGYFQLPQGTTAQRPSSPANGMTRVNNTTNRLEIYSSNVSGWVNIAALTNPPPAVEYLVVAGGGGGASYRGGAGGAGGLLTATGFSVAANTSITVTVGAGGAGGTSAGNGIVGSDSVFSSITATGGGRGGGVGTAGGTGGSGGGGGGGGAGGSATSGQGSAGGLGLSTPPYYGAGGGGGASAAGTAGSGSSGGAGGAGTSSSITGSSVTYAGGGAGGQIFTGGPAVSGGSGGGGSNTTTPANGGAGTANTGGGGAGAYSLDDSTQYNGGAGGSGVVVIRYADTYDAAPSTTGSPTITVAGGYRVYKFTASGSITF
jgi:hypothetical protein